MKISPCGAAVVALKPAMLTYEQALLEEGIYQSGTADWRLVVVHAGVHRYGLFVSEAFFVPRCEETPLSPRYVKTAETLYMSIK